MASLTRTIRHLARSAGMLCTFVITATGFLRLCLRSPTALAAENLFLRKQLALYQAHHIKPRHATNALRVALVWLSQWFDWQPALAVVQPETFQRWRRQGLRFLWRGPSQPGRPPIPPELQTLTRQMARDNCSWGQRRIANELRLKLGLQVSPRTIRKYMPAPLDRMPGHRMPAQRWRTFVRNHAWDLITSGMAANLIRGRRAFFARIIQITQRWWNRSGASQWRRTPPRDTTWRSWRSTPASRLAVWSPIVAEVIRVDQRSPPDGGPSCIPDPGLAPGVTSVHRFDVCPVRATLCGWQRAGLHMLGSKPLSKGGMWVAPWRRAA
jgi:hypothetical protein